MAQLVIDVRPGTAPAPVISTEVDGVAVRLAFRWLPNLESWVMQVRDPGDVPLSMPLRVSPGVALPLDTRDPRVPPGSFRWEGPEPYGRDDLGVTLVLLYDEAADG